jgi:hypothetical protein
MSLWVKFLSVPARLSRISVFVPGVAPFEDVPITESPLTFGDSHAAQCDR